MKNGFFRVIACGIVAILLFAFAACNKEENPSSSPAASPSSVGEPAGDDEQEPDDSSKPSATGKFSSIAEFLASDAMQQQLDTAMDSVEGEGMEISVTAEGNKLIYSYTYKIDMDFSGAAELLEEGLEAEADTFQSIASKIKLAVDVEDPVVVVTYLDNNGDEIYTAEFTEDGMTGSAGEGAVASTGKYGSVAEFVASDEMQEELEAIKSAVEGQGMRIDITGEGNKLIYTYTFTEALDLTGAAELLKEGLDSQSSTFENVASTLKTVVDVENPVVVVTYLDIDGNEIYSAEFSAE